MRPARLACLLCLSCFLALPAWAPAWAQAALDGVLGRGVLRVALTGDYRPFSIKLDGQGSQGVQGYEGLDVDMADALAKALGVRLEIVPTTWGALLGDLRDGKYDIGMGGISVTLDRQKQALFSAPLLRTGKAPIARCADQGKYQTLADIDRPGVRVLTNPGGTNERFARANIRQADIVVFPNNAAIFDELIAGRGDVMMTDSVETRLQQRLHPELCAINPDRPLDFGELAYLLPRDPVWKAYVDQWLHVMAETGERGRLFAKWIP